MALAKQLDNLNNLDDSLKALYVEREGIFYLDVDGGFDDTSKLKSALDKERSNNKVSQKALKELRDSVGDLDPAAAREALSKIQELEEKQLEAEGKSEELFASRLKNAIGEKDKVITDLQSKVETGNNSLRELIINTKIQESISRIGSVNQGAMPMIIQDIQKDFTFDDNLQPVARGEGGEIRYSADGVTPLSMDEYAANYAVSKPYLFQPSTGSGGKGSNETGNKSAITSGDPVAFGNSLEDIASGKITVT